MSRMTGPTCAAPDIKLNCMSLGLVAIGMAFLFCLVSVAVEPRFYFHGDNQIEYYPYFSDIAHRLISGQPWFFSLATFNDGNYVIEMQYGVFNPVSLLICMLFNALSNYLLISYAQATIYSALLFAGTFYLGRSYGLRTLTSLVLATFVVADNNFHYLYLSAWSPAAAGAVWFVWGWAAFKRLNADDFGSYLLAVLAGFLVFSCGYPHPILAFSGVCCAIFAARFLESRDMKVVPTSSWIVALAFLAGAGLALPIFLPGFLSASVTDRVELVRPGVWSLVNIMTPTLGNILNVSNPAYTGGLFMGGRPIPIASFYSAWFVLPLLPFLVPGLRAAVTRHKDLAITLAGLSLALMLPEKLFVLRYPARFLMFFHVAVTLLALFAFERIEWTQTSRESTNVIAASVGLLLLSVGAGFVSDSPGIFAQNIPGYVLYIMLAAELVLLALNRSRYLLLAIWAGGILFFVQTHLTHPGPIMRDWGEQSSASGEIPGLLDRDFKGYDLFVADTVHMDDEDPAAHRENHLGDTSIYRGVPAINGDSSVGNKAFNRAFCTGSNTQIITAEKLSTIHPDDFRSGADESVNLTFATPCSGTGRFFARESVTGAGFAGLMKVRHVFVQHEYLDLMKKSAGDFRLMLPGRYADEYESTLASLDLPGTVSWVSSGLAVRDVPEHLLSSTDEWEDIANGLSAGRIVFARMAWPGYRVDLDGQDIPVSALGGFLLSAEIPAGALGRLHVSFTPPGFWPGMAAGGLVFVLASAGAFLMRWKEHSSLHHH
jgi:hypothetical protein